MDRYVESFGNILVDSGAFSELNSGNKIDLGAYREWTCRWRGKVDAISGVDNISGDWRISLANYEAIPWTFPTFHDTDPPDLLKGLLDMSKDRGRWIGIGLKPPRHNKEEFLRKTLDQIPDGFHVHGWALRSYTHLPRLDSVDSTNWFLDAMKMSSQIPWLTYAECLELIVKRYKRSTRKMKEIKQKETEFCFDKAWFEENHGVL